VLGTFVPTERPDRAVIPPAPNVEQELANYRGGDNVRLGEAFDPSPKNIESRITRRTLANGIQAALLAKQTRGGRAVAVMNLHWGDEKTLMNRDTACDFAGQMLMRGTKKRTRAELKEAFDKLNARVSVGGEGFSLEARGENLIPACARGRGAARALFSRFRVRGAKRAALSDAQEQGKRARAAPRPRGATPGSGSRRGLEAEAFAADRDARVQLVEGFLQLGASAFLRAAHQHLPAKSPRGVAVHQRLLVAPVQVHDRHRASAARLLREQRRLDAVGERGAA